VVRLEIPPLRERREDILALSQNFLEKYAVQYHRPVRPLPLEMQDALMRYSWPGNVRQLENIIKRFVVLPDPQAALADLRDFPTSAAEDHVGPKIPPPLVEEEAGESNISLKKVSAEAAERAEKEIVLRTLEELNWNRKQAARQLDISYKALLNKLRRWEIGQKTKRTDIQ
jgi:two-component system response regulator AtoC